MALPLLAKAVPVAVVSNDGRASGATDEIIGRGYGGFVVLAHGTRGIAGRHHGWKLE